MTEFHDKVRDRLIRYAKICTQSVINDLTPSTACQHDLAALLEYEIKEMGIPCRYDRENCIVYAKLAATCSSGIPVGFVAHMDTAPDAPGEGVKPWVLEDYDGKDIVLNHEKNIIMKTSEFPNLLNYIHQDLVLTDGTTLLGGDDKAAIAELMTLLEYLNAHPEIEHPLISVAFTPDEEVGGLAKDLDLAFFEAPYAYTIDGDYLGYYEDETFNASMADIEIHGRSVHTGTAKDIMINAADLGVAFCASLPSFEKPQYTEGREGFFHLVSFSGDCEACRIRLIIRDHDAVQFEFRNSYIRKAVDEINRRYPDAAECTITVQYRNLKEVIDQSPFMISCLTEAIKKAGVVPHSLAFRGGTDGSALSWRGLPCPNLSAGYENAHGRFEYVPIQSMEKNVEILLSLIRIYSSLSL